MILLCQGDDLCRARELRRNGHHELNAILTCSRHEIVAIIIKIRKIKVAMAIDQHSLSRRQVSVGDDLKYTARHRP